MPRKIDVKKLQKPIDTTRPKLKNTTGRNKSFSTEKTIGVNIDGKEVLIPTIVNGKRLSEDKAVQMYMEGKNKDVGKFSTRYRAAKEAKARTKQIGKVRGKRNGK